MITTLTKVNSSIVYAIGYDPDSQNLEVVFRRGKIWLYEDVPRKVYEALMAADSIGHYMRTDIIDCYPAVQLT